MSYQVVAPLVLAQDQSGATHHVYQGGIIQWLSDEQAEHFLAEELVVEIGDEDPVTKDGAKPPKNAGKPVLVDWVVANVVKDDGAEYTEAEAGDLTKPQLWAIVDSIAD